MDAQSEVPSQAPSEAPDSTSDAAKAAKQQPAEPQAPKPSRPPPHQPSEPREQQQQDTPPAPPTAEGAAGSAGWEALTKVQRRVERQRERQAAAAAAPGQPDGAAPVGASAAVTDAMAAAEASSGDATESAAEPPPPPPTAVSAQQVRAALAPWCHRWDAMHPSCTSNVRLRCRLGIAVDNQGRAALNCTTRSSALWHLCGHSRPSADHCELIIFIRRGLCTPRAYAASWFKCIGAESSVTASVRLTCAHLWNSVAGGHRGGGGGGSAAGHRGLPGRHGLLHRPAQVPLPQGASACGSARTRAPVWGVPGAQGWIECCTASRA